MNTKNITINLPVNLLNQARKILLEKNQSLNGAIKEWLHTLVKSKKDRSSLEKLFKKHSYINAGRKFTRDEMNTRG